MLESKWVTSAKDILALRRALVNPVTCMQFRRFVAVKGDNLETDVFFWQEIQKYKVRGGAGGGGRGREAEGEGGRCGAVSGKIPGVCRELGGFQGGRGVVSLPLHLSSGLRAVLYLIAAGINSLDKCKIYQNCHRSFSMLLHFIGISGLYLVTYI